MYHDLMVRETGESSVPRQSQQLHTDRLTRFRNNANSEERVANSVASQNDDVKFDYRRILVVVGTARFSSLLRSDGSRTSCSREKMCAYVKEREGGRSIEWGIALFVL